MSYQPKDDILFDYNEALDAKDEGEQARIFLEVLVDIRDNLSAVADVIAQHD